MRVEIQVSKKEAEKPENIEKVLKDQMQVNYAMKEVF